MKKIFLTVLLLAVMLPMMGAVATAAEYRLYQVQFCDERLEPRTDLSYVAVYNTGSVTASTLKAERSGDTAVANPMLRTSSITGLRPNNGLAQFYSTKTSVDLIVHVGGARVSFYGVKPNSKYFVIPYAARQGAYRTKGGCTLFNDTPTTSLLAGGAAITTDNAVNLWAIDGLNFECLNNQTQTLIAPVMKTAGLDIMRDATEDDGWELTQGITAGSRAAFTVGTDGPFHFTVRMDIVDISCTDDFAIGWRVAAAYNDAIDDYTDMAAFNLNGTGTTEKIIQTETILNSGSTVTTALTTSTWSDGDTKTLTVKVALNGAVTYLIDGVAPSEAVAFTFDTGDVIIPFMSCLLAATPTTGITPYLWDCGLDD
jgi:hypothetical protein